ncbi:DUF4350 domain-containing protein [Alcanivorax sediminis]|uniref:DUF4350 domain-containing protein n=1 Tax=Alcanivorax sediminis TaxID=2663008 RepID=A0A6N7LZQ6_9GAMM|nr:DUF4350 domain-containing protein [Alcanivorax sediminis]MQX53711.1 DUF4350 domain-containing protein [Alcanivorax sediminis]
MATLRKWFPALLALTVLGLFVTWYALTEPVTTIHRVAPDSAVQRDPFHAAQAWLNQREQPTRRILSAAALFPLPDVDTTLVFDKQRGLMTRDQVDTLINWVMDGGDLIVAARPLPESRDEGTATDEQWRDNDPLLYPLGITVWEIEDDDEFQVLEEDPLIALLAMMPVFAGDPLQYCMESDNEDLRATCESLFCDAPEQPETLELHSDDDMLPRHIQLYSDHVLWHDSWDEEDDIEPHREWHTEVIAYADNEHGSQLIQLSLGEGQITVLTDLSLWDNEHLLYFDHAWLLAWLAGDDGVWFVRSVAMPPLLQWLWQRAPELILALLVLLALWLWLRIPRQGPLQPVADDSHHDYLQHLHASGYFQWRTEQQDNLLTALRQQASARLRGYHNNDEKALTLAARDLNCPAGELHSALNDTPQTRDQLIHQVRLLQALRSNT